MCLAYMTLLYLVRVRMPYAVNRPSVGHILCRGVLSSDKSGWVHLRPAVMEGRFLHTYDAIEERIVTLFLHNRMNH